MNRLPQIATFCALEDPYMSPEASEPLFHSAMLELTRYHHEKTPGYSRWLSSSGIAIETLAASRDWSSLPPLHANYFKRRLPLSVDVMTTTELHSSGTSGQKSAMQYDDHSLHALMHMSDRIFDYHGWNTPQQQCNYLMLSHEPESDRENTTGSTRTDQFLCKYAAPSRIAYALRKTGRSNGASHEFDPYGVIRSLQEFAEEGLPVRLLGFPSFLWFVLQRMREMGIKPLALHPDSLVLTGGGWKTHVAQSIDKSILYQHIGEQLGISAMRCRDGYGAVEHGVPYIECSHHRLHVPTYARAFVRDSRDMRVLGYNAPGLLHLLSPYITSCPAHSIMLGDLATLMPGSACGCGIPTDCFTLHGRAGTSKNRSCAVAASELIKETRT